MSRLRAGSSHLGRRTLIAALCASLPLTACGGNGSASESVKVEPTKPRVEAPSGPPPKKLIIEDLQKGSGLPAKKGDTLTIHYQGVGYDGKLLYSSWFDGTPYGFKLGLGLTGEGFEEGMVGMKAGGRRKLSIPARLAISEIPVVYIVDLLKVEKQTPRGD